MSVNVQYDSAAPYGFMNMTGLPDNEVNAPVRQVASALAQWVSEARAPRRRGLLDRNAYIPPSNPLLQMELARRATQEDDIVGGAADVTEGLIFQGAKWECESPDDADIFNQISIDLDLDAFLRAAYRELFTCSQVVVATWWGPKTYTVRGRTMPEQDPKAPPEPAPLRPGTPMPPPGTPQTGVVPPRPKGVKRRKKYQVNVPTELTILDSTRIIPIGNRFWGEDRLAWHATAEEDNIWSGRQDGLLGDPTMAQLLIGRYVPDKVEKAELVELGINPDRLLELHPNRVWRHCLTRPNYTRWPDVRMRGVFGLLDLKRQLMEADRVQLVGAANYILIVKKGSKEEPAYQTELEHLKDNFDVMAKLPVIISDHRLTIEIVTPKTDLTLDANKYEVLDSRIIARLMGSLPASSTERNSVHTQLSARMIARRLGSVRHMLKRSLEARVARPVLKANPGTFEDEPNLAFTPRQVQLDTDAQITQAILALRTQKELSRESLLEYFGFDESVEAQRREYEEESGLDDIFKTTVPFDSPLNNQGGLPNGAFGATGGRPTGGGQPPKNSGSTGKGDK